jgi:hypothetical protein
MSQTERHERTQAAKATGALAATPRPRTPAEIQAEQGYDGVRLPAKKETAVPARLETRTPVQTYLDEIAPASIVGRMIKFSKDGKFVTADDDATIDDEVNFAALCDQTLIGFLKFNGQGEPPDRHMGLLYDGWIMPPRESLGDVDKSKWEIGLSGQPQDPWQHHVYLVLQNVETQELFTYVTSSQTGRRAIGNLLRHYDRVAKTDSSFYPLVRLKVGGFNHRDERVGWVPTPVLAVVGRVPRVDVAKPEVTGSDEMNDALPF